MYKKYDEWTKESKSHPDWIQNICVHPGHNPPGYMVTPLEGYTHICPACGKKQHIHTNRIIM